MIYSSHLFPVNATVEYGLQDVPRRIDMMDAQQFIQYYVDAHNNAWVDLGDGRSASDPNSVRDAPYRIYFYTWLLFEYEE